MNGEKNLKPDHEAVIAHASEGLHTFGQQRMHLLSTLTIQVVFGVLLVLIEVIRSGAAGVAITAGSIRPLKFLVSLPMASIYDEFNILKLIWLPIQTILVCNASTIRQIALQIRIVDISTHMEPE